MGITISVPDALRQSVEAASGGKNTVIYDAKGYPSIMVVVPRFRLEDIDPSLGSGTHPAFIVGGQAKSEFFVAKYQAVIHDGLALSLPAQDPTAMVTFDQARAACNAKGQGWHLMTNAEWAGVALWCWRNGFLPRGNTQRGMSSVAPYETGRRVDGGTPGEAGSSGNNRTLTGSGPAGWYHDGTLAGIADLAGNVSEWVGGLRLFGGEIQVIRDNDAAVTGADQSATSPLWRAVSKTDGALVAPGTPGSLAFDSSSAGTGGDLGPAVLNDQVQKSGAPAGYNSGPFEALTSAPGITPPPILKALCLAPVAGSLGGVALELHNYGEKLPLRGGAWFYAGGSGIFSLSLGSERTTAKQDTGFRPAYVL